jgi:NAD(P)-dependent dehydrogenase (short-subunit alcohol dehydrogenase family)
MGVMETAGRVLITGTSRGLGLEFVRQYVQAGWRVYATCRSPERALELSRLAAQNRDTLSLHPLDVSESRHIRALRQMLAGEPLDMLINNAGVLGPKEQGFGHTDADAWVYTLRVNTIAPLKMIEALADNLAAGGHRVAATVSSRMASISENDSGGYYIYRSSKAAVNAVVKSAAVDLAERGISVVALHPGWVRTAMGGPEAELDAAESVRRLRKILERVGAQDSGSFFDVDGQLIPW